MRIMLYNEIGTGKEAGPMSRTYHLTTRRERRRGRALRVWHTFVLIVGYAAIIYELVSWGIYFYVQWTGK